MIFDTLCGVVERHAPSLRTYLDDAALFFLDAAPHDILDKSVTAEELQFLDENFHLPFPVIAIEDAASCVILADNEPKQIGLGTERTFIECQRCNNVAASMFGLDVQAEIQAAQRDTHFPEGTAIVSVGRIKPEAGTDGKWLVSGVLQACFVANSESVLIDPQKIELMGDEVWQQLVQSALRNAMTAIEEVRYFNTPNRLVFETRPLNHTVYATSQILRSHDRPIYSLLTPEQITEAIKNDPPNGMASSMYVDATKRSRQWRAISSIRVANGAKSVVVPAEWIGPVEARGAKREYRVRLDL